MVVTNEIPPYLDTTLPRVKPLLKELNKKYPCNNRITKEYLKYLDNTKRFFELTDDKMIKYLGNAQKDWFKILNIISCHLGLDKLEFECVFHDKEIPFINKKGKSFVKDFYITIGDVVIDVEMNNSYYKSIKYRNNGYLNYSMYYDVGGSKDIRKVMDNEYYQLNLNDKEKRQKYAEREFITIDKYTGEIEKDKGHIFVKYLERFYKLYYTCSEITDEIALLASFKAKSYSELYEMMSFILPDKMLASFMESVIEMNEKIIGSPAWLDEVCAKQIEEDDIKYAKEEAMLIGRDEGFA